MISEPLYSHEFVGRRDELGFLEEAFRAVCDSHSRFVVIEGEAGIGKSRLAGEFCASRQREATVARGHCSEHARSPYLPFTEILQVLDTRSHVGRRPREHSAHAEEKWAYFNAVAEIVRRESARCPLVVVVEDAQWADSATVELLRFLLERTKASRVLFIITMRTEAIAQNPPAAMLRSAAARERSARVQLRPLRRHEIKHLVNLSLHKRNLVLEPAMVAQIEVLADGNPLFAEELAQTAIENGVLAFDARMPLSLQAVLSERLVPFSTAERETLFRAAVLGERFDAAMLASIADVPLNQVLQLLQRAVTFGLVEQAGDALMAFTFRHALIRQGLADQLVLALAAPLHVRIAQELEALPNCGERAAELAYHWSAARVADKARAWNEAAAEQAWNVYAYRDAIRFYSDALKWNYPAGTQRAYIFERLGTLLYIDGCGEEPAHWFRRAREEYAARGNATGAAQALLLLADQMWVDARTQEGAQLSAEAALELDRLGHEPMHAQALLAVARYDVTLGNVEAGLAHLSAARRLRASFDSGARASWHEVRGESFAVFGQRSRALEEFRAAARLAAQTGVSELIAQIENNFALSAFDLGDLDLAVARHQIAVDEAHRTAMTWRIAYCSLNYARTLSYKGQFERARVLVRDSLEAGVTTATYKTKIASVGIPLALLLNDRALLAACADETALELAQRSGEAQRLSSTAAAFAALRVAQGSPAEARGLLARALQSIVRAHRSWDLFIAVAKWGGPDEVAVAASMLAYAPGRPLLKRAYSLLFRAIVARDEAPEHSARLAGLAAAHFDLMQNTLYRDASLEYARGDAAVSVLPPPARGIPQLTARQMQIANLAKMGETNRAIAQALDISEHTVEHHLSGIFARLGLHSRAQLAHVMAGIDNPV